MHDLLEQNVVPVLPLPPLLEFKVEVLRVNKCGSGWIRNRRWLVNLYADVLINFDLSDRKSMKGRNKSFIIFLGTFLILHNIVYLITMK